MAILHISSEEHGLKVRTAMPESTQAHRQKQVNLTWHTHGYGKTVYQSDRNHNLFILN